MKTALYVRVSTDFQAEQGYSIDSQLDKLHMYCKMTEIEDYEDFIDPGYTASNLNRPEMQRLIAEIKLGIISTVIVYKLDRLSRKTKDTLYFVEDIMNKYNVSFISVSENIDTSTSSGKLFLTVLSSIAQFERENIMDRTMQGMKKKSELGLKSRTPKILIGYKYDDINNCFLVDEYEAMQIRDIFTKYLDNVSVGAILNYLNENYTTKYGKYKSIRSIQHILDNETYTGKKFVFQGKYIDGKNIPTIIDEETFFKVKAIRDLKKKNYYRHTSDFLLTGLLFCGECGARLRGRRKNNAPHLVYYVCYSRDKSIERMAKSEVCQLPYLKYKELNQNVEFFIHYLANSEIEFNKHKTITKNHEADKSILKKEIEKIKKKCIVLIDLLIDENIQKDIFTQRLESLTKSRESLEKKLESISNVKETMPRIDYTTLKKIICQYDDGDIGEKRLVLRKIIQRIEVSKDMSIKIVWNI